MTAFPQRPLSQKEKTEEGQSIDRSDQAIDGEEYGMEKESRTPPEKEHTQNRQPTATAGLQKDITCGRKERRKGLDNETATGELTDLVSEYRVEESTADFK